MKVVLGVAKEGGRTKKREKEKEGKKEKN